MTHITGNIRHKPSFICNCCSCCCELLGGVMQGFPHGVAKAPFVLEVDMKTCIGCGLCWKNCNAAAIEPVGKDATKRAVIRKDRCLGAEPVSLPVPPTP